MAISFAGAASILEGNANAVIANANAVAGPSANLKLLSAIVHTSDMDTFPGVMPCCSYRPIL